MLSVLIWLVIGLIVIGLAYWVISQIPLPAPIKQIGIVILVVVAAIWLIYLLMSIPGIPAAPFR